MTDLLRVIDFGRVTPLRSQTLWHAVAYGVTGGQPPTLSFARPSAPYVCLGYHRDLAEIDQEYCRGHGLPVYRRMVGGGPVYLDDRQLFFQICVPARSVSPSRRDALAALLTPAVAAFRAVGVPAGLDADGEICLGEQKICGHGAGQIEDAVVVCGNLIEAFDHERAAGVLALPDPVQRARTLALMRRYVTATPADPAAFTAALTAAYAGALHRPAVSGHLTAAELSKVTELDEQFTSDDWLAGPVRSGGRAVASGRQVKVRAGIWTFAAQAAGAWVVASVISGRLDQVTVTAPGMNGQAAAAECALAGVPVSAAADVLARFGEPGRELATALAGAEGESAMTSTGPAAATELIEVRGFPLALDRRYHPDTHMWVRDAGQGRVRIGMDPVGVQTSGTLAQLSLPAPGTGLTAGLPFGQLEAVKFVGPLVSPVSGTVLTANEAAAADPGLVERDPFGAGWLIEAELPEASGLDALLADPGEIAGWYAGRIDEYRRTGAIAR